MIALPHAARMMGSLLLAAIIAAAPTPATACVPPPSADAPVSSLGDHRVLRAKLGEPMPAAPTMVMLYGAGGHLENREYSIVVTRDADGTWHGTAVGRSQIWVRDAPSNPMKRAEWVLDGATGRELDRAIARRCAIDKRAVDQSRLPPPPLNYIAERIEVVQPGCESSRFSADVGGGGLAALIRPPL